MTIAPNRAVAIFTPLVFAPAAGAVSVLIAKYFPGVTIDNGSLEAIFVGGATIAFAKAGIWLKGWQDYEKRTTAGAEPAAASSDEPFDADEPFDTDEPLHTDEPLDETEMDFDDELIDLDDDELVDDEEDELLVLNGQGV